MKLTYLWTQYSYKPEYQIWDFIRVNCLEDYDIRKVLKIMVKLYALYMDENYPWYFNPYSYGDEDI